jgi:hypothetical protein
VIAIVSGGQTGVDQAALRAAQARGLRCGGWCPPGRVCEGGTIPARFELRETTAERSARAPEVPRSQRTEWNVRDSDATLIVTPGAALSDPGTAFCARCAALYDRPLFVCDPDEPEALVRLVKWLRERRPATLNVAGPSEDSRPGVGEVAYALLLAAFDATVG